MKDALRWFEIPAMDIHRAVTFYSQVLGKELEVVEVNPGYPMAVFFHEGGVGGAIVQGDGYSPSPSGCLIYLSFDSDLNVALERVAAAGGKILMPKTAIGKSAYAAYILDSEGNKVGLHAAE